MNGKQVETVGALYDIHGNIDALEAVLSAALAQPPDRFVIGGDVVLGPMPRETLARCRELGARAALIRGNCDRLIVEAAEGALPPRLPGDLRERIEWVAGQLEPEDLAYLQRLPETLSLTVRGVGEVLFCHATPRSDDELFTARTPAERVRPMLAGATPRVVVCGHTHMQFDREVDGVRIVNAGSVGMPFGRPGAYWLWLGPGVELRRTEYDRERAAAGIRATSFPQAEEFAAHEILSPRTEETMLATFEAVSVH